MEHKGYILAFLAGIAWGTNGIISHYLGDTGIGPYEQTFLRLFFAFLAVFTFYMLSDRRVLRVGRRELIHILLIGVICQGLMSFTMYKSIAMTSVTVGVILSCTGPLFTALLSRLFFKEEIGIFKGLSLAMGFYGAFLVVAGGDLAVLDTDRTGILIGLVSGLAYGFFPILKKRVPAEYNSRGILMYSFLMGALLILPLMDGEIIAASLSPRMLFLSLLLGIVPTVLAYTLYSGALLFTTPTRAGIMSLAEVPAAALIGHFFLREYLHPVNILGIAILLTGTLISKGKLPVRRRVQVRGS